MRIRTQTRGQLVYGKVQGSNELVDGKVQGSNETYDLWQKHPEEKVFQFCDHDVEKLWELILICEKRKDVHWVITRRISDKVPSQPNPCHIAYEQHPALGVVISPYYRDSVHDP